MNIAVNDLGKTYGGVTTALSGVTFSLPEGEVFGLLGPNGAGKTTMVKLLCGMLVPTRGSMRVLGIDPTRFPEKVHAISGVLTETARMYGRMTAIENLVFFGGMFGMTKEESRLRGEGLLKDLGLASDRDKRVEAFSTGMHQRLSFARALLHRPRALFLDEPTAGLDPENAAIVNHHIQRLAEQRGVTVFLCTHQLRYAQEMCTTFGLLSRGEMLAMGTLNELRDAIRPGLIVSMRAKGNLAGLGFRRVAGDRHEAGVAAEDEIPPLVRSAVDQGVEVYEVLARRPSLEEIYFGLVGRDGSPESPVSEMGGKRHV